MVSSAVSSSHRGSSVRAPRGVSSLSVKPPAPPRPSDALPTQAGARVVAAPRDPDDSALENTQVIHGAEDPSEVSPRDAGAPPPPAPPVARPTVGPYTLLERLVDSGSAELYRAERRFGPGLLRRVLLKRVPKWQPEVEQRGRLLMEEAELTALLDHPNVARLLDAGEDADNIFLALEHPTGTNLHAIMERLEAWRRALPIELAVFIIAEAARGMAHAHGCRGTDGASLGVVLRDRTPFNVLISVHGEVRLSDFELATTTSTKTTRRGVIKGTYEYLAPEYIAGDEYTASSDLYALGVMLFELLAGRPCFRAGGPYEVLSEVVGRGVPWRELEDAGVPRELAAIVGRATNPVVSARFSSASELVEALELWIDAGARSVTSSLLARVLATNGLFPATPPPAPGSSAEGAARRLPELRAFDERGLFTRAPLSAEDKSQPPLAPAVDPWSVISALDEDATRDASEDLEAFQRMEVLNSRPVLEPGHHLGAEASVLFAESYRRLSLSSLMDELDSAELSSPFDERSASFSVEAEPSELLVLDRPRVVEPTETTAAVSEPPDTLPPLEAPRRASPSEVARALESPLAVPASTDTAPRPVPVVPRSDAKGPTRDRPPPLPQRRSAPPAPVRRARDDSDVQIIIRRGPTTRALWVIGALLAFVFVLAAIAFVGP